MYFFQASYYFLPVMSDVSSSAACSEMPLYGQKHTHTHTHTPTTNGCDQQSSQISYLTDCKVLNGHII